MAKEERLAHTSATVKDGHGGGPATGAVHEGPSVRAHGRLTGRSPYRNQPLYLPASIVACHRIGNGGILYTCLRLITWYFGCRSIGTQSVLPARVHESGAG